MQKLGQHFLKSGAVIPKIIAALDLHAGETVIEIGPGHGELTMPLAAACEKIGVKIIAVEKDAALARELATGVRSAKTDGVDGTHGTDEKMPVAPEIMNADILEFLGAERRGPFKIAGNIPYYLTGHLLRILSELETKPLVAVLMIQKEVAERICAAPPRMNRLAASVQFWAEPKIIARVPREDFTPPPKVDSAVIKLQAKNGAGEAQQYYAAVRALFAQPRKTILNNLAASPGAKMGTGEINKNNIAEGLRSAEIDPASRPQDLTIENIVQIAGIFFRKS